MLVVLDVLAQLGLAGVLQPGFELGQHVGQRELLHGLDAFVAQGDVSRLARLDTERDADQLRLQGIEAVGFRVDGRQLCGIDFGQPFIELCLGLDAVVGHFALLGGHGHLGAGSIVVVKTAEQVAAGLGRASDCFLFRSCQRPRQAFKAIFIVEMAQILRVQLLFLQIGQIRQARRIGGQVAIGLHRHQLAAQGQLAAGNGLAQVVPRHALDAARLGDQAVKAPNSCNHFTAVFGPTLVTPGTLSTASPTSAW